MRHMGGGSLSDALTDGACACGFGLLLHCFSSSNAVAATIAMSSSSLLSLFELLWLLLLLLLF